MKGRASGPASRSGFSAASSAVRHEASSASRRTFSFAARTGAFLPVRAALFSRPCRNALPVGRCLPAGVLSLRGRRGGTRFFRRCLSGAGALFPGRGGGGKVLFLLLCRGNPDAMRLRGAGRQGVARELPARAGRGVFSEEVPWQAHGNVPACTPLTAGNHEGRRIRRRHRPAAGRRAAEACSSACAVPGLRLFLRVRLFCTAFFPYPCGRSACFSCARARPPLCLKKRRPRAAHARALCRPGMEKTQARSMVCRMSGNICPYRG